MNPVRLSLRYRQVTLILIGMLFVVIETPPKPSGAGEKLFSAILFFL